MKTAKMKIEYRKQIDSETAPWQLLTNIDELLWNGVYALRVTDDDGSHNLPFRFGNDDTVTIVVKDHSHEGMLQGGRTIVQTITYVERSTGKVFVYTRTRYNVDGVPSWNYWSLATEGEATIEIPKATRTSLGGVLVGPGLTVDGDGNLSIADNSIDAKKLTTDITTRINDTASALDFTKQLVFNENLRLNYGALVDNDTPYSGTKYTVYTDKILANGELLVLNENYTISTVKIFDGEQQTLYQSNLKFSEYYLDNKGFYYQFEFKKNNSMVFTDDELQKVVKLFQRKPFTWNESSCIDDFVTAGTFTISGFRADTDDGLPIYNTGNIDARLAVLSSGKCVTQILTLLNVGGGDGNIYVRTCQDGSWGMWGKLQTNVEVGAIGLGKELTFDNLIDNGIYSGVNVISTGIGENGYPLTDYENFVLVVINAYLTGGGITQLKYSLQPGGTTSVVTRTKVDDVWSEWGDVANVANVQDGTVTASKLSADVREKIDNPLRPLFLAAGAEYNDSGADKTKTAPWGETVTHKAGHYYLNGLGDITDEQMYRIYYAGRLPGRINYYTYKGMNIRTTLNVQFSGGETSGLELSGFCNACTNIENVSIMECDVYNKTIWVSSLASSFVNCKKLRRISPVIKTNFVPTAGSLNNVFLGCAALEEAYIHMLKFSISFSDSPKISKESILQAVQNASPASAITITLHPDAYARLANDADIVAALEAQPLVSLVSA